MIHPEVEYRYHLSKQEKIIKLVSKNRLKHIPKKYSRKRLDRFKILARIFFVKHFLRPEENNDSN